MSSSLVPRRLPRCLSTPSCPRSARRLLSSNSKISRPEIIFSGIQPTGIPHLGNYLGALQRWVKLQNEAAPSTNLVFSVVDLHAITLRQDPKQLRLWRKEMLASLLAVGLDPKRSIIFNQSDVPAHSELMWILSCQASMGYLSRMTQWKSKSTTEKEPKLGLFSYPVLQAADILVHRATHVPVGEDQAQHLEFARECAGSFNHAIGRTVLVPPDTILSPARRVMSLTNPTKKMSKSDANPKSRILITDDRDAIAAKLRTAVTDSVDGVSYEPETRPGVSNLVEIMFHMGGEPAPGAPQNCDELAKECEGLSMRALKERVTDVVDAGLAPVRERYYELMQDESALDEIKEEGAKKARESAERTMRMVRDAIGF
ncbi:Tryptophan--tRNA ligase [Lasiodiplodia hormozganensis]|uniref:Tryptophan--tRNA ligase, mitochondrial n=2 Tax=Lasiodiplodia TaxID=66739 RepID=A0A5N5CU99_9PEZI|nr:Tryptophanyl-tRNA synthetase [Lasiodiplodia theobromae]KAB2568892.1 Tryptophan--tRNA ligase [Lasiodiplodia theobromae]KAF4543499.1 Tryptophanyl-tRNA synthetase [Lasiodiplodia theobromae]KAK0622242.1 Tryptophan--tRNA ligase [Lasiodiplodia hormozganensis]